MGLRKQFSSAVRAERGNMMLAAAMMLAGLVVLVALGLTLAPTGSDGITDESTDGDEFDVVTAGLQQAVFVESNDTLDPAYDPEFHPPGGDGPAPIDNGTIVKLLSSEPFTDEQVVQIQSLLTSLGYRSMGGSIAALEPVAAETETGVLVRLGNIEPRDLGGTESSILENATTVQDVELVFERATLPASQENATTAHIGNWTLAAYRDGSTDRVGYQLGSYDPDGAWNHTDEGENLNVTVHDNSVNGEPVPGGIGFDPGEPPVTVWIVDTNRSDTMTTHGGLNLVAVGADSSDVNTSKLSAETDWQEVVTRPVFNTTYLDATTTVTTRLGVDTDYTHFEYDNDGSEPFLVDVSLDVETEDPNTLEGVSPAERTWLPQYSMENISYRLAVTGVYSNGTEMNLTDQANITVFNRTAAGLGDCDSDCVELFDVTEFGFDYQATPHTLTDVQVQATVPELGPADETLRRNLSIIDPYSDTTLSVPDTVSIGDDVTNATFAMEARKSTLTDRTREVSIENLSGLNSLGPVQVATQLQSMYSIDDIQVNSIARALTEMGKLNQSERTAFLAASDDQTRVQMLGLESGNELAVADFFGEVGSGKQVTLDSVLTSDAARASALGLLGHRGSGVDVARYESLGRYGATVDYNHDRGQMVTRSLLFDMSEQFDVGQSTPPPALDDLLEMVTTGVPSPERKQTAELFVDFVDSYETHAAEYVADQGGGLWHDNLTQPDITDLTKTYVMPAINDTYGNNYPDGFAQRASSLWADMRGFTDSTYHPSNVAGTGPDTYRKFLVLAGVVEESKLTTTSLSMAILEQPQTVGLEQLFDAIDYSLLDNSALSPTGSYELAPNPDRETLVADWDLWLEGTYTGYEFTNYTATDPVTVVNTTEAVDRVLVGIDYNDRMQTLVEDGVFDNASLAAPYPLAVGDTRPVTTTVYFEHKEPVTDPDYVSYDLLGPTFDPGPGYGGPTDPSQFATLDVGNSTITAHTTTGQWVDNSTTPHETGPIVVQATAGGETATAQTSAVDITVDGYAAWDRGTDSQEVVLQTDGDNQETAAVGVEYAFRHGSATYGWHNATFAPIGPGDYAQYVNENPTAGSFEPANSRLTVSQETDGWQNLTFVAIDEGAARGLHTSSLADQATFNASLRYDAWCYGCLITPDPIQGARIITASAFGDTPETSGALPRPPETSYYYTGTAGSSNPGTKSITPLGPLVADQNFGSMTAQRTFKQDQIATAYLLENFGAAKTRAYHPNGPERLARGTVDFRDNYWCEEWDGIPGSPSVEPGEPDCYEEPVGMGDFVNTNGTGWASSVETQPDPDTDPTLDDVSITAETSSGSGHHEWTVDFTLADDITENQTYTVSFDGSAGVNTGSITTHTTWEYTIVPEGSDGGNPGIGDPDAPGEMQVQSVDADKAVVETGESVTVTAEIKNTGAEQGDKTVYFATEGDDETKYTGLLGPGQVTTVSATLTMPSDAGEYTVSVMTPEDTGTTTITVLDI